MSKIFEALQRARKYPANDSDWPETTPATAAAPELASVAAADAPPHAPAAVSASLAAAAVGTAQQPGAEQSAASPVFELRPTDHVQPGDKVESKIALMLDPTSVAAEQYRLLRTTLLDRRERDGIKCIVIGSPGPGDGKTITALNLAMSFAQLPSTRVLLVEADLRRPAASAYLGLAAREGLPEYLTGTLPLEQAIISTGVPGLSLLPSRALVMNQTEVLHSPRLAAAFVQFRQQFDWVIVDGPPLSLVADHYLLAAHCDGTLLVVRPMHTSRELLKSAADSLNNGKLLGVVLNASIAPPRYKDYYGYGYGYGPVTEPPKSGWRGIWRGKRES